jgi:signal transduction histidine kinase
VSIARREVDVFDLALHVCSRFRELGRERGVHLRVDGGPASVIGDVDLLGQSLVNLVQNALTHTTSGGSVTVTVTDGPQTVLAVSDTGSGIPPEELPHIFDRFYRVEPSRDRNHGGAGLGLEITKRIVEAHGGRLTVESAVGRGTTFRIVLPSAVGEGVSSGHSVPA